MESTFPSCPIHARPRQTIPLSRTTRVRKPWRFGRYNVTGTDRDSLGVLNFFTDFVNLSGTSASGLGFDIPASLPLVGSPMISAGQAWHFQAWHRDSMGGANFSNGLSSTF